MSAFKPCEINRGRMNRPFSCSNEENSVLPEFESSGATPRAPMPTADLAVMKINMYEKMNKLLHHTDLYNQSNLIIRRGQEFTMGIVFNRPLNPQVDLFYIEFLIGNKPVITQKTLIRLDLGENIKTSDWNIRLLQTGQNENMVAITPAADCIVGLYSTYVTVITNLGKQRTPRNTSTDFYVLFNPWAIMDQVYLSSESDRKEYVLNDVGMIYTGDYVNISNRPWNYGQARIHIFQSDILEACIFILDFGKMPLQYRADAVKVVRKASAMINSLDDDGVLEGKWSDEFESGTAPTAWTGSVEILRKYLSEGGKPVKYGQCWVFAGVFNTFLRCLGLPARVITNYCSAHDNSGNLMTDIVLDEDGSLDRDISDTIWNYHCWNEVFLKRRDMPDNYSGWQAVDATPQEISEGYYRCGPSSVVAIKNGSLGYSYDAGFVFSEVNSDVVFYKKDKYGNMNVMYVESNYIGKLILTKMTGSKDYNDITDSYKYNKRQVSRRETGAQVKGVKGLDSYQSTLPETDVKMCLQATKSNNEVILTMSFTNLSNEPRTVTTKISGKSDYYTGATRTQFTFLTHEVSLEPLEYKQEAIVVASDEYKNIVIGQSFLSFLVYAIINETSMSISAIEPIYLGTPPLFLEVSKISQVGKEMFASLSFTNTLDYDLTDVTVRMEGLNLFPVKSKMYSVIERGSKIKWIESFKPQRAGILTLVACLDCANLRDVCTHLDIIIQPSDN
ncbi:Coagulation factor XIII A chain [Bagarius yarrelli]|uniref:Coagulation factor XIII A chain n=1 Tax=Bagarius yarrelli TaxID=175774 RepID=A0A556TJL7_BAGYA|nr:Coagulation factor XIII A chain [Bagarius yarrelli]